jgi:Tfp pilus assembly protein PilF
MIEQKTSKRQVILISASLVLLVLIAFEPVRHNDFVGYDDGDYVIKNIDIQSGFTRESVAWAFTSGYAANWHPVTWLSHMLDIELFGLNPLGHHLHNVALHTISTVLLFLILRSMTGALWPSAFAAMAFGIHPLRVESVAWASERKDTLSMLFFMLTVAAYIYYTHKGGIRRYVLVVLCFSLGLMAKPMLVTVPFILLILDWWPLNRIRHSAATSRLLPVPETACPTVSPGRLIAEKIPLFVLTLIFCIITYSVQQAGGSMSYIKFYIRVLNALTGYLGYLGKIVWPADLAVLYPYPAYVYPLKPPMISFIILTFVSVFIVYSVPKRPYLMAGWLWYVVTLIPVIGLVQVGIQSMADRYTYLPSIGIFMALSWTAAHLSAKWRYRTLIWSVLGCLTAAAMTVGTRTQLTYWKDTAALFDHTLAVTKNNYIAHKVYSGVLEQQERFDEAAIHLSKALKIWPDFPDANINMASLMIRRKQFDDAMVYLHKTMEIKPDNPRVHYYMGALFQTQLKFKEAIQAYEKTLQLDPDFTAAMNNLAWLLATTPDDEIRNPVEAVRLAEKGCKLTSFKDLNMLDTLAAAFASVNQFKEAIEMAQKALDLAIAEGQKNKAGQIAERLQLYRASKSYYETQSTGIP